MLIITWLLHCILIIGNVTLYHNFSQIHLSFPTSSKLLKHLYFTESSYTTLVFSIFLNTFSSLKCSSLGNFMHEYPLVVSFLDLCILFTHVGIHSPNSFWCISPWVMVWDAMCELRSKEKHACSLGGSEQKKISAVHIFLVQSGRMQQNPPCPPCPVFWEFVFSLSIPFPLYLHNKDYM